MDYSQAFTYIFEDKQWGSKLVILGLMVLLSIVLLIVLIGLIPLSICLGFLAQLTNNVRNGHPRPLPGWNDYTEKMTIGGHLLIAILLYNLPTLMLVLLVSFFVNVIGGGFLGITVNLMALCCAVPLILLYNMIAWSLLAAGLAQYVETGKRGVLYRPVHLWDVVRSHGNLTLRWMVAATVVNVVALLTGWIPCIGTPVILTMALLVHGHFLGQYARQLAIKAKV
jgi:hypothetical protein